MPKQVTIQLGHSGIEKGTWKFQYEQAYYLVKFGGWTLAKRARGYDYLMPAGVLGKRDPILLTLNVPTIEEGIETARTLHQQNAAGKREAVGKCHGWPTLYIPQQQSARFRTDPFGNAPPTQLEPILHPAYCQIGFGSVWEMHFEYEDEGTPFLKWGDQTVTKTPQLPGLFDPPTIQIPAPAIPPAPVTTLDTNYEAEEWRIALVIHNEHERDKEIVEIKKQSVLLETGRLSCEACKFDFVDFYGALGNGYAECHHRNPLSQIKEGQKTKLGDLSIVCANCHRMLHRDVAMTIELLRDLILKKQNAKFE